MQLALASGSNGPGTVSTTRATGLLAAGVALAGAGLIAVPTAPMAISASHQAAVELTATTSENLDALAELLSGPNPIFSALGELAGYYGQATSDSLQGSWDGIEGMWSGIGPIRGLENTLPEIIDFLKEGDVTHAWNLINWDMVFGAQYIFQPLFNHPVAGETVLGAFGIGTDLSQVWTNVMDIFDDFSFWKSAAKSIWEPFLGFQFALAENFSFNSDHEAQDPFDALLNGYVVWDEDGGVPRAPWQGLLTSNGTFAYLFDKLPEMIGNALTSTIPVPEVDVDPGDAAASASLLDFGWLDSLFN
ncbi:hypothetical protein [Mycolicibacter arupensis]|uniref:Uncharacterized protein n=1 Tax=Mycolicibacter arupensis TaxID=342002 RepID=A0A0F5MZD8_9MYCO|nr:hypothetical protein [Mycolicibacter arupensis]KKC00131.1 hypothetical protein WR43_06625 [Mycolicibacter arupensis]MCV7276894.1 hypothetical protein [Mycolicibacter arupensis]ORA00830.1 hypothetical protein BST15_01655 [Mycolicibacter arupensis]